jgi:hypothetical protein
MNMKYLIQISLFLLLPWLLAGCNGDELQQPVYQYAMTSPADTGARYPNLHVDDTGKVYMSWLMGIEEDMYALQYSTYDPAEERWAAPMSIHVGTNFFVNWADFPSIVGYGGEPLAAHWLRKVEGGPYAYHVYLSFPGETRLRWTEPVTAHLDNSPTEHGFVSLQPISEDRILAIWLDGRNTDGRGHHEYSDIDKAMTLRSAEITREGEVLRKRVIDEAVCDCCQTDLVKTDNGFIAVYRNRTEEEVRDIYISHYDLETGEWSDPHAVHDDNWVIAACPVNGPRVAADGDFVAVAWQTRIDDEFQTLLARSTDGGMTFQEPIKIAGEQSLGRVDLIIDEDGSVYVSWMNQRGEVADIMLTEVSPEGTIRDTRGIGVTSASRNSGFPRMVQVEESILFAWTQTHPLFRVRTAMVPIR